MELTQFSLIIVLAFGLGMLHALDADHIMAVSSLIANQRSAKKTMHFCLHWAIGHGSVLLLVGILVFVLGWVLPPAVSEYAEMVVALVLILIGTMVLINLYRQRMHVHFHRHDDLPAHAHWHSHVGEEMSEHGQAQHRHEHGAMIVGMLHGLAGSAPLLAIIPITMIKTPLQGFTYLLIFSFGVLLAMILFGGLLGVLLNAVARLAERMLFWIRALTGMGAIVLGGMMLKSVL